MLVKDKENNVLATKVGCDLCGDVRNLMDVQRWYSVKHSKELLECWQNKELENDVFDFVLCPSCRDSIGGFYAKCENIGVKPVKAYKRLYEHVINDGVPF